MESNLPPPVDPSNLPHAHVTVRSAEQTLRLDLAGELSVRQALDGTDLRVRAACGGLGTCGACLIKTVDGSFNPPTLAERQKILPEELAAGMRLACQLRVRSEQAELLLENPAPKSSWKSLASGELFCATPDETVTQHVYAIAVDLGTTHIRLSLWHRRSGRRIASRYSINPQVAYGADVLTRLDAAHEGKPVSDLARDAIIEGVRDILSRDMGEIQSVLAQIGRVLIVGNTAMLALICNNDSDRLYQPENWQSPITCRPADSDEWRRRWRMPNAVIDVVQPMAGFIGSDLLADLVAIGVTDHPVPLVLADFGTNTEIALWDGRELWVTSVPGGPAFEGVGMRNGLTAESGAIYRVNRCQDSWQIDTIDDARARGFCASGFIDTIALLLDGKQLKPSGRFADAQPAEGLLLDGNNPRTAIFGGDIDIFQRAKASTAAAMSQLLVMAGLTVADIGRLWICGSFGRHLNVDSAIRVGLLPPIEASRIALQANASLAGCERLLLTPGSEALIQAISERTKIINLGGVLEYENRFVDNLRLQPMAKGECA